jgi:hypothetical protein
MPPPTYFTALEVAVMFDEPAILTYPECGGVQVDKAGISGFGSTVKDATVDWGHKFARMVTLPKVKST